MRCSFMITQSKALHVDGERCKLNATMAMRDGSIKGFTLIELMIVVAVVGILAAIAYPSYTDSVRKARRPDAKTALLDLAAREERYFSTNNAYTATPAALGYSGAWPASIPSTAQYFYAVTVTMPDPTTFSINAVPQGDQASDSCGTYTITQTGNQTNSNNATSSSQCW